MKIGKTLTFIAFIFLFFTQNVNAVTCSNLYFCTENDNVFEVTEYSFSYTDAMFQKPSTILLKLDYADTRKKLIDSLWSSIRDTLAAHKGTVGYIRRQVPTNSNSIAVQTSILEEVSTAKVILDDNLENKYGKPIEFSVEIESNRLIVTPSEIWVTKRIDEMILESIDIIKKRFVKVGIEIDESIVSSDTISFSFESPITQEGARLFTSVGKFSINHIEGFIEDVSKEPPKDYIPFTSIVRSGKNNKYYYVENDYLVSNEDLILVTASRDKHQLPSLDLLFNDRDGSFKKYTTEHVGYQIAFIVDDEVISTPVIVSPINFGVLTITGLSSPENASILAIVMNSGFLPIEFSIVGMENLEEL